MVEALTIGVGILAVFALWQFAGGKGFGRNKDGRSHVVPRVSRNNWRIMYLGGIGKIRETKRLGEGFTEYTIIDPDSGDVTKQTIPDHDVMIKPGRDGALNFIVKSQVRRLIDNESLDMRRSYEEEDYWRLKAEIDADRGRDDVLTIAEQFNKSSFQKSTSQQGEPR